MQHYRSTKTAWMHWGLSVVIALVLATGDRSWAADDPYLAGLHDEAQKLGSLDKAKKEQEMLEKATAAPPPKVLAAAKPSANAKQVEFETELEQYPAGFGLYKKLNVKDRDVVFQEYLKAVPNRRHAAAIRKTIELSVSTLH
jgi:hypothetical protein